jgi:phage major head subunit gpT-like protein
VDINRQTLNDLYVGFKASFQRGMQSRESGIAWQRIATLVPSTTRKNAYPWLGQMPKMREWIGDRAIKRIGAHRFEIENKPFELTVAVDREAVEDDEFGVYAPFFEELGISMAEWPDEVVYELLKAGETAIGYDDVPFFSTSHPHEIETLVSNFSTGAQPAWYLLDTTRAIKPLIWQLRKAPNLVRLDKETDENVFHNREFIYGSDARGNAGFGLWQLAFKSELALDETNLMAAYAAMTELTNDEGRSLKITPNLLVVPPALALPAKKLVSATTIANGADNVLAGLVDVYVTNYVRV